MTPARTVLLVLSLLLVAACGGDESSGAESAISTDPTSTTAADAAPDSRLAASTVDQAGSSATGGSTATRSATGSTAAGNSSATGSDPAETTAGPPPSTTGAGSVLEPGDVGAFASPSGNILCVMSQTAASCWISDKNWTIDQPDAPECAESDWGNAIDVAADGVTWPCYTDFIYDPDAAALAYGDAMVVGEFRCDSDRTGVTCRNASGQGFTLARAAAQIF